MFVDAPYDETYVEGSIYLYTLYDSPSLSSGLVKIAPNLRIIEINEGEPDVRIVPIIFALPPNQFIS